MELRQVIDRCVFHGKHDGNSSSRTSRTLPHGMSPRIQVRSDRTVAAIGQALWRRGSLENWARGRSFGKSSRTTWSMYCCGMLATMTDRSVSRLRATCGESLLTTDGEPWLRRRKFIQPAFQPGMMEHIVPTATEAVSRMLDRWSESMTAGRAVDIVSEMMHVTLQIAAQSLFGADIVCEANVVERSLATILQDTWRRLESWVDLSSVSPVFENRTFRDALRTIDEIVERIINSRRRQAE